MPATSVLLAAEGLVKSYGRRRVLDGIGFHLAGGEILGFLGANGAGKSTTMRILLSLVRPDQGTFHLLGERFPGGSRAASGRTGALIEQADLFDHLTARENLRILGRMQGVTDGARIDDTLRAVGLFERANDRVRKYSQGMKQRLGLAQAILHRPALLILDEPMNGLDPGGIRDMRKLLRQLAHGEGIGILFSSHRLGEVERLADRILVIDQGRKVADGRLGELLARTGGETWELASPDLEPVRAWVAAASDVSAAEDALPDGRLRLRLRGVAPDVLLARMIGDGLRIGEFRRVDSLESLILDRGEGH
jgi:ABC-2 type transport system ATP-binding protein